jgi:N-acetyl-anhydromuramyl-L-alanine amidase AmpD
MIIVDVRGSVPASNFAPSRGVGRLVTCLVLHITGDSEPGQAVRWFQNPKAKVSAHEVIEKDGSVVKVVDYRQKAYHAGAVNKPTAKIYFDQQSINPNIYSIGIECVSSGEPLTKEQTTSLRSRIDYYSKLCNIPKNTYHIIGHNELDSVERRFDPIKSFSVEQILKGAARMNYRELLESSGLTSPTEWIELVQQLSEGKLPLDKVHLLKYLYAMIEKVGNK